MTKVLCVIFGVLFLMTLLQGDPQQQHTAVDSIIAKKKLDLEERKLQLEERRLYLTTLEHSEITTEKAREMSDWILKNLKDYPQGKKARHREEDLQLLTETFSSVRTKSSESKGKE